MNTVVVSLIASVLTAAATLTGVFLAMRTQRLTTLSTLRVSLIEDQSTRLRDALADELTLTYEVEHHHRVAGQNNQPWPGEHWDLVTREDRLYNKVLLHLDETRDAHHVLRENWTHCAVRVRKRRGSSGGIRSSRRRIRHLPSTSRPPSPGDVPGSRPA
jgi:hypothetical protein